MNDKTEKKMADEAMRHRTAVLQPPSYPSSATPYEKYLIIKKGLNDFRCSFFLVNFAAFYGRIIVILYPINYARSN